MAERRRIHTERAKIRGDKVEWLKNGRYKYKRDGSDKEKHNDWKKKEIVTQSQPTHTLHWDDICLESGEIKIKSDEENSETSSEEEEEEREQMDTETQNSEEFENIIKQSGLHELKNALEKVKIKCNISERNKFSLYATKTGIQVDLDLNLSAYFQVEYISKSPPAVIFEIKQITKIDKNEFVKKARKGKKNQGKSRETYCADNTFRQAIICKKSSKIFLVHCGRTKYSNEDLLKFFYNINSLLQIAPNRIRGRYLGYNVNLTSYDTQELDPRSHYYVVLNDPCYTVYTPFKVKDVSFSSGRSYVQCSFSM